MSSTFVGSSLRISIFGQSHSKAIGMTMDGLPAGIPISTDQLQIFLNRRAPGRNDWSTPRKEEDQPEFLCGIKNGISCGTPLTAVIHNHNMRSSDYNSLRLCPRPGHADYTAQLKYKGFQDYAGGGHFSGRLTAPLCLAGGILKQFLAQNSIHADARILRIADVWDTEPFLSPVDEKDFPAVSEDAAEKMKQAIQDARQENDSVGGVIECRISGVPGGLGSPVFDGIENRIAQLAFAVPAVKGIEFGSGFAAAGMRGSEHNDAINVTGNRIKMKSNHAGGILGGISTGEQIVFRVAIKPTPSIGKPQETVNLETLKPETLCIEGRHDPCIVPRAVPVLEAVAAIAISDFLIRGADVWN